MNRRFSVPSRPSLPARGAFNGHPAARTSTASTLLRVFMVAAAIGMPVAPVQAAQAAQVAQAATVDRAQLMNDLSVLAHDSMAGRQVGTPGNAAARAWIVERLQGMGLTPRLERFEARDGVEGVNVVAEITGTGGIGRTIVLTAHYDHLGVREGQIFNGADDNASGTAGVLAIGAALMADRPAHDVTLIFFDAEEGGLRGARAWVDARSASGELTEVALNINLDMVSRSDDALWVAGTHQNPALRPIVEAAGTAAGVTLRFGHDTDDLPPADNWVMASDHGPFHAAGVPFLYFGVEDHPDYHQPTDDVEKVDAEWYGASIETILGALRALDGSLGRD